MADLIAKLIAVSLSVPYYGSLFLCITDYHYQLFLYQYDTACDIEFLTKKMCIMPFQSYFMLTGVSEKYLCVS